MYASLLDNIIITLLKTIWVKDKSEKSTKTIDYLSLTCILRGLSYKIAISPII